MLGSFPSSFLSVRALPPSLNKSNTAKAFYVLDIICLIISLYFILSFLMVMKWYIKNNFFWTINFVIEAIGYLSIPALQICIVVLVGIYSSNSKYTEKDTFSDLPYQANIFDSIYSIQAVLIGLLIYRFLCVFRLNNYFDLMYNAISNSLLLFIPYVGILIIVMVCFSVITQTVWGTYRNDYTDFPSAFLSNCLSLISTPNINFWIFNSSNWSIIFYLVFFLWVEMVFPNICIGIFMESYRIAALKLGYPEASKDKSWGVKDYFKWLFKCLPIFILNKMGLVDENQPPRNNDQN